MRYLILLFADLLVTIVNAQQVVDTAFQFPVDRPAFGSADGPLVLVDIFHNNYDVEAGNYQPFFKLMENDGFRVEFLREELTRNVLRKGDILIVINALADQNVNNWSVPVSPAFTKTEIEETFQWVLDGGSLLLVADHMPFPEAVADLAKKFDTRFTNGFAIDTIHWDPLVFKRSEGTLLNHSITNGSATAEKIDSVVTFWGQAFLVESEKIVGLLMFDNNVVTYNPDTAWRFRQYTPAIPVKGWYQAAAGEFGQGKVLILGEAGMLTAQLTGPNKVKTGMNAPNARQNPEFILNAMRWLALHNH